MSSNVPMMDPTTTLRLLSPLRPKDRKNSMCGWDIDDRPYHDSLLGFRQYNSQFSKRPSPDDSIKIKGDTINAERHSVFARLTTHRESPTRHEKRQTLDPIRMSSSRQSKASPRLFTYIINPSKALKKRKAGLMNTTLGMEHSEKHVGARQKFAEYAFEHNVKMLLESALCYNTLSNQPQGSYLPSFNMTRHSLLDKSHGSRKNYQSRGHHRD